MEAAEEAGAYQRQATQDMEADFVKKLEEEGVTVTDVDRAAFQELTKGVYDQFADQVPVELIQQVLDTK